ncbi:MAG: DUF4012 domain-containing protein [Ktedonobacteraceae bacterium]|nr:DUF4012 domain-containing protein [Ktedonobacteraceae bacterium]
MLEIRDKNASTPEARKQNISSWQEASLTGLNSRAKKRFSKNKSAVIAYFTGDKSIREITTEYNLSTEQLLKMVTNCLKQHEDGSLWGYRALLPGIVVKDYSSNSVTKEIEARDTVSDDAPIKELQNQHQSSDADNLEDTAKRPAATIASPTPVEATPVAEHVDVDTTNQLEEQNAGEPVLHTEAIASPDEIEIPAVETSIVEHVPDDPEADTVDLTMDVPAAEIAAIDDPEADTVDLAADVPAAEIAASDHVMDVSAPKVETTDHEAIPDNGEAEVSSLALTEPITPDELLLSDEDASAEETHIPQQAESLSSTPQEEPIVADIPTEAMAIEEQQEQPTANVGGVETQAVAVTNDEQLLPRAKVTTPLLYAYEEDTVSSPIDIYLLPKYTKHVTRTTASHMAQRRRFVRKRWMRDSQDKTKRQRFYRSVSIAMVSVILLSLLLPIGVGLAAYNVYNNVNGLAHDGINHLMTVKDLLPTSKNDIMSVLNANKLKEAQNQLKDAETDFIQLQQLANRPDIQSIIQQVAPQYSSDLSMAKHLLQVALDVSRMGQELSGVGVIAANIVHSSPLATNSAKPLISVADISDIKASITHALYYMDDIQQNMNQVQLSRLPISVKQKTQLTSVLAQLPSIRNLIVQNQNIIDSVTWLLGIGQPRRFLVQTMDTGELRPGGGFTGQYGMLSIQNGRVAPFSLRDVALLDYAGNGTELGRQAPSQYSWMNFGNWGLRDSNLSGDYPTTAQMNMQVFQEEGGGPIDGVIDLTPTFIGHIIDVTGPIHVTEYNETITAANLEDRLHYYQQDQNAITVENAKSNDYSHQARKAFTSLLGKILLQRVRSMPTNKLITIIKNAVKDIQSRDLEIYFTNPAAEQWLINNGYSGGMSTFSRQDGFMLVQANISISKASQFVRTTEQDNITLDAQGGATHNMAVTLDYNQTGPVYGYDTYSDYMRLYVPHSSQLISGDGFDTGHALCTPPTPPTTTTLPGQRPPVTTPPVSTCNSLPASETLNCPDGNYSLGTRSYNMPKTADVMGAPTATTSDLPGRGMFGGMTVTPKNCTSTIMLSWYVPNAVKHIGKQLVYPLVVQKQGGYVPGLELNVDASAIKGMKSFSFKGNLHADRLFNIR